MGNYYGRPMSEAERKADAAIYRLGQKKAELTKAIKILKSIDLANHPDLLKAIDILMKERKRLDSVELF